MKSPLASPAWVIKVSGEAGLLLILPLIFSRSFTEQFTYPKRVLGETLIILLAVMWILGVLWQRVQISQPPAQSLAWPQGALALAVLVSCVNSPVPGFTLRESVYFLCGPAWALVLTHWIIEGRETEVRRLYTFSALGGSAAALIGVVQWTGHDPLVLGGYTVEWGKMVGRMRLYATFGNPNFVAGYLIATVFLGAALAAGSLRLLARVGWGTTVAVMLAGIVGTGSRGAWIGLGVGLVAATLVLKGIGTRPGAACSTAAPEDQPRRFWPAQLGATCLGLMLAGSRERLNAWVQLLEGRLFLWRAAWPMFTQHPILGNGWATFQLRFLDLQAQCLAAHPEMVRHWTNTRQLHNDLLQFLLETGVLGLFAWGWLLWVYAKRLRDSRAVAPATRLWVAASVGGFTAILVDSLFNFQFAIPPTFILMFTLLAVPEMLAPGRRVPKRTAMVILPMEPGPASQQGASRLVGAAPAWDPTKEHRVPERREFALREVWRCLASLGVAIVAVILLVEIGREAVAEQDYVVGWQLESRGEIAGAEEAYRRGIRANPLNGRVHYGLARALYLSENYPEALEEIPRAERTFQDSHLEVLKARIEDQMGLAEPALTDYRRALALDPTLKTVQADIERLRGAK